MNPLVIGGAVAAVMAGPPLYGMVQAGQLDGSSALGRGVLVAGACTAGAYYVLGLIRDYEREGERNERHEALMTALAEAEEAAARHAEAAANAAAAAEKAKKPS